MVISGILIKRVTVLANATQLLQLVVCGSHVPSVALVHNLNNQMDHVRRLMCILVATDGGKQDGGATRSAGHSY